MEENLEIDYISTSDIYKLQELTQIQILIGGCVNERQLSEALRLLIERS